LNTNKCSNFVVDKIRYGQIRIRWNGSANDYGKDVEKLSFIEPLFSEYATVIAAGRDLNKADLLLYPKPDTKDYHGHSNLYNKKPLRVAQTMIREDVWQTLLSTPVRLGFTSKKVKADYHLDHIVKLYETFVNRIKSDSKYCLKKDSSNEEWKKFFEKGYFFYDLIYSKETEESWLVLKNEIPFTVGLATHWNILTHRCLPVDEVKHVLQSVAELVHVYGALSDIRVAWRAGDSVGPQYGEWEAHKNFHKKMAQISAKELSLRK